MQRGRRERAVPSRARASHPGALSYARRSRQVVTPRWIRPPAEPKFTSRNEGRVEADLLRGGLMSRQAPQVDGQSSRGGYRMLPPAPRAQTRFIDQCSHRFVVGLPAGQAPDQLDQGGANGAVAAAVDGAFAAFAIARMDAGTQPRIAGN